MNIPELRTLGGHGARLILDALAIGETTINRQSAASRLGSSLGSTDQTLRRLVRSGWLSRAGKGIYLIQPAELGSEATPDGEAYSRLAVSEPEAVVGYGTAAFLWNLTTQLRHEIIAVSPKRSWTRELGPVTLRRIQQPVHEISVEVVEKNVRGCRVRLFSIERTTLDCLHRPDLCGGMDEVAQIVRAASRKWDWAKVTKLLAASYDTVTRQRLGYFLDRSSNQIPEAFRAWLIESIPKSARAYLEPGRRGRYDKIWKVIA